MIDFSWFYFIGRTRLRLSDKETGRLTLRMFNKMYGYYKAMWSYEMRLAHTNTTFEEAERLAQKEQEWL